MSFRKRNTGISSGSYPGAENAQATASKPSTPLCPGLRPSPLDGRATTSTGTPTLDSLFAGHTGLPLGSSVLIEESGTTDYAGALLRYYAAEGLVQGHHVHVVGLPEQWGRELPGLVGGSEKDDKAARVDDKMKIAWRYERLGQFGQGPSAREPGIDRQPLSDSNSLSKEPPMFCHTFDLTKRLVHPSHSFISFLQIDGNDPSRSPFISVMERLSSLLSSAPSNIVHRVVIPSLLSPGLYPTHASLPEYILRFLHSIRALLATNSSRLTAMISLPLSLYPRSSGLVRWMELLSDGVVELSPLPYSSDEDILNPRAASGGITSQEEPPQGLLRIHRLPIFHERGGGATTLGEDWAFNLSRRKFTIKPFSLPPIKGDTEAQEAAVKEHKGNKSDMAF